jgi:hypothetical protein
MKTLALLILCFASVVLADDFKTIGGKEYKNAKVSRVEPDGIVITFSGGIVKIPFTELSAEIQKKYGYDPKAAEDFQQQTYQADVVRERQLAEGKEKQAEERAKYWSEHSTPIPVERQSVAAPVQGSMLDQRPSGGNVMIYGTVLNVVDDGLLVSVRETNSFGTERIPGGAPVLLIGNFAGVYDHDKVQATGSLIGSYQYTSVYGAKKTARALAGASVTKLTEFPPNVR